MLGLRTVLPVVIQCPRAFLFLLVCTASQLVIAQQKAHPEARPGTYIVSTDKALEAKLDSIFSSINEKTPGVAVTVIEGDKVIAERAYGMASLEYKVPFTHSTVVRLPYSEGREFISIAAALMEKDGLLQLKDKVQQYFPALPAWSMNVTIQDLLNHSSGFADEWATLTLTQASMANRVDPSQFMALLYNQPTPSVEPGRGYMYSNSDFGLLRLILEKASGEDLAVYMKRRVFDPLGMGNSRIHNDKEEVIANQAFNYTAGANGHFRLWLQDKTSPGGNYFVLSSASDLEKWAAAHADTASFVYAAVQRLKRDARPIPVLTGTNYVFGYKEKRLGAFTVTAHMGVNEYAYMARIPEKRLTVILWSNHQGLRRWNLMERIFSEMLQIKRTPMVLPDLKQEPVEINQPALESLAGWYQWKDALTFQSYMPRKRFTLFLAGKGVIRIVYGEADTLDLVQLSKNRFRDPDYPEVFEFSKPHPDSAMQVTAYSPDGEPIRMVKRSFALPMPNSQALRLLTGKYYSRHLDFYLAIQLNEKGQLIVKRPTIADKVLDPFPDGDFRLMTDYGTYSSESWVRFHYDKNGAVSHLTISHPRLMDHRFERVPD